MLLSCLERRCLRCTICDVALRNGPRALANSLIKQCGLPPRTGKNVFLHFVCGTIWLRRMSHQPEVVLVQPLPLARHQQIQRPPLGKSPGCKFSGIKDSGCQFNWLKNRLKTTWDFILRGGKGSDWRVAFSRLPPSSRCRAREDSTFQLDPFPFVYLCTLKCRNEKRAKQLNNLIIYFSSFALKIDPSNSKLAHKVGSKR